MATAPLTGRLAVLADRGGVPSDRPRSYDDVGRCWGWETNAVPGALALDVERLDRPLDSQMPQRWGADTGEEFLRRWTIAETLAKLDTTPIMEWLAEHGLPPLPCHEVSVVDSSRGDVLVRHFVDDTKRLAVTVGHRIRR